MTLLVGTVTLVFILAGQAGAGELFLTNGSRLDGELANEVLVVSTGSDLVEVSTEHVGALTRDEVRLKDGRVLRGTLVGGYLKVRTALGEIAVKPDELQVFQADAALVGPAAKSSSPTGPAVAPGTPAVSGVGRATTGSRSTPSQISGADTGLLPSAALYQGGGRAEARGNGPSAPSASVATPVAGSIAAPAGRPGATMAAAVPVDAGRLAPGRRLVVVASEIPLLRDALAGADTVAKVVRGEQVTYLDFIDRRLQILNVLVFDGGHWIKVRAVNGSEGWVPAGALQEVR